jgi:hypothetical protein
MARGRLTILAGLALLLTVPPFAAAQAEKPVDVSGDWEWTVETPVGNFTSTMKLVKNGESLSGVSINREGQESKLNDVKLSGKTLTFTHDVSFNGADHHLAYTGTVEGDTIKGTFEAEGQTLNWSARRVKPAATGSLSAASPSPEPWRVTN